MILKKTFLLLLSAMSMYLNALGTLEVEVVSGTATIISYIPGNVRLIGIGSCIFSTYVFEAIDPNCVKQQQSSQEGPFFGEVESGFAFDLNGEKFSSGQRFIMHYVGNYRAPLGEIHQPTYPQITSIEQLASRLTGRFREGIEFTSEERALGVLLSQKVRNRTEAGYLAEFKQYFSDGRSRAILDDIINNIEEEEESLKGEVNIPNMIDCISGLADKLTERFRSGAGFDNDERTLGVFLVKTAENSTMEGLLEKLCSYFSPERAQALLNDIIVVEEKDSEGKA